MFDDEIIAEMKAAVTKVLDKHLSVLRSVAIVLDYRNGLNDTPSLQKAMVQSRSDGTEELTPVAVIGCIKNTLLLLEGLGDRLSNTVTNAEVTLVRLSHELLKVKEELANVSSQKEAEPENGSDYSVEV